VYEEFGCSVLSGIKVAKDEDYDRYGFAAGELLRPGLIDAHKLIEKPGKEKAPSDLATVSGLLATPDIFQYLDQAKEQLEPNAELYYNDALSLMLKDGKRILACEIKNGRYFDTGNKLEYMKTIVEFAVKHPEVGEKFNAWLKEFVGKTQ
jgi:UTP--glucose-1-phosphate uridylyltransferase